MMIKLKQTCKCARFFLTALILLPKVISTKLLHLKLVSGIRNMINSNPFKVSFSLWGFYKLVPYLEGLSVLNHNLNRFGPILSELLANVFRVSFGAT